ncbi:MAG TPA: glycogen/starch synthase [Candidatus Limnocylindrales bacterium]|nr:glycogen/starch synthase [Candidatus Limnocylindrales bacterium]
MDTTTTGDRKPRILICTPEITELPEGMGNAAQNIRAKGGGLGDISAGLIQYLHTDGRFELHVVLPRYDARIRDLARITYREIDAMGRVLGRQGVHLVTDSAFSSLTDVYGEQEANPRIRRAEAFQRYIINDLMPRLEPDLVHCNDWMTGLVPAAARAAGIKSVFTLHNVFTEHAPPADIDRSGIDIRRIYEFLYFKDYPIDTAENWRQNGVDFTATGIHAADVVNTVSPTFLEEMISGQFDEIVPPGVAHAMREKHAAGRTLGILNAPADSDDPRINPHVSTYDVHDVIEGKRTNKELFQKEMGLRVEPDAPLFFWPSRLYAQKGPELLAAIASAAVRRHGLQIALVASGDRAVEAVFRKLAATSDGRIAHRPFREDLSMRALAGSDFVLMPSLYEPCGLPQMMGPRFGTLAVARATGGLKDTVMPLDASREAGNGFVFKPHTASGLAGAITEAVHFYREPEEVRRAVLQRVMQESLDRFTLANTARAYIELYEKLIAESRGPAGAGEAAAPFV